MANTNARFAAPQGRPGGGPGGGGPAVLRGGEKARDFGGTISKLLKYLKNYKYLMVVVMFIAATASSPRME